MATAVAHAVQQPSEAVASAALADNDKKRPADDSSGPSMTKDAAAKALSSLWPPYQAKSSLYIRFKSLLLKDAKERRDTETKSNITKVAKEAWATVKNLSPPPTFDPSTNTNDASASAPTASNLGEDVQRYLLLKGRAMKDEQADKESYDAKLKAFCSAYVPAATAHLQWRIIEASNDNYADLKQELGTITTKLQTSAWDSAVDRAPLMKVMTEAMEQLKEFKEMNSEETLLAKLRNATDEELAAHVKEHRRLLGLVSELNSIKKKDQAREEKNREAEERELSRADMIPTEIERALKKQMKYTDSSLKYRSADISYTRGGVTSKVFAKAFGVPVGTTKATIAGSEVGRNYLRYGACLECSTVDVKLVGNDLRATASYFLTK